MGTKRPSSTRQGPATGKRPRSGSKENESADLLSEWVARAQLGDEVRDALVSWLARQFASDQFAKLEQGSHATGGVPLRKVFVDLPISAQPIVDQDAQKRRTFFVKTLLSCTPAPLSGVLRRAPGAASPSMHGRVRMSGRHGFTLIGGPGQGKSTVGQLACQLHRAALLAPFLAQLQPSQQDMIRPFTEPATQTDLGWPEDPLLPLRIILPEAAAWLAQQDGADEEGPRLLKLLAAQGGKVSASALDALLRHAPFLLVLDGLDEVGAAEDRTRLIGEIRELLGHLGRNGAWGQIVATTRPQGYTGDLERLGVDLKTMYLTQLLREEALAYGGKLAEAKLGSDPERVEKVKRGLEAAAREGATERLFTTPLQVTILAALVERRGRVPKERWGLFERYFQTIYDREVERGTYASPLLQDYRMHIQKIHARVGLLLQVEAEQAGGTSARMSRERLQTVADLVLEEDEVDGETRADLVRRIVRAAEERLVFLVEPEPGWFGFEIRSLQEFMAAWALALDGDDRTLARLQQIAKAPMFRAVTLFLASKFFTDGSPLREALAEKICGGLDEDPGDEAARELRLGAFLALEMLEEGSALNQPRYARRLLARACGILEAPPGPEHVRLAQLASQSGTTERPGQDPLHEALRARVQGEFELSPGAWLALCEAADLGMPWAKTLGDEAWGKLQNASMIIAAHGRARMPLRAWLASRIQVEPEKIRPAELLDSRLAGRDSYRGPLAILRICSSHAKSNKLLIGLTTQDRSEWEEIVRLKDVSLDWHPWGIAAQFVTDATKESLALALRELAVLWNESSSKFALMQLSQYVPWPLAACIRLARTPDDLRAHAHHAESGLLGDRQDWLAAEQEWRRFSGSVLLSITGNTHLPWDIKALRKALPADGIVANYWTSEFDLSSIRDVFDRTQNPSLREYLIEELFFKYELSLSMPSWADIEQWSLECKKLPLSFAIRKYTSLKRTERAKWLGRLERLARKRIIASNSWDAHGKIVDWLIACYMQNPEYQGLLYWLREKIAISRPYGHSDVTIDPAIGSRLIDLLPHESIKDPAIQMDAALIRAWLGDFEHAEIHKLFDLVEVQIAKEPGLWWDLIHLVEIGALSAQLKEEILLALLHRADLPREVRWEATSALRRLLQWNRPSNLSDQATWTRLGLPRPLPQSSDLAAAAQPPLPEHPVALSRIEIRRVRGINDLTLEFAPPQGEEQGQWTVLIGPNGAGKTTILRAVALALRNLSNPKIWPKGTFATPWCTHPAALGPSAITVQLASSSQFRTTITRNGSETFAQEPMGRHTPFPLFAYGCRRGSALGGAARAVNTGDDDGPEIATLFDEGAPLVHAETWLKEWDGAAARNPDRDGLVYEAVLKALRELLAVDDIKVIDRQVLVWGASVGQGVPLAALSDGYLTTAGWFLDLVARWIDLASKHTRILGEGLLRRMTGLVLLDEIDLHLHPRWQLEVIPRVKRLLPKMSFLVTTHNPLTLVGALPEEIWVLSMDDAKISAARGTEVPMLLTGGQIYSRYFGIKDLYPHELGEALRRFGFLSSDPRRTDEEDQELHALLERLRAHGIDPGWEITPRERAAPPRKQANPKKGRTK